MNKQESLSSNKTKKHFYVYYSYEQWGRGYIGRRECWCLPEEDVKYLGSFKDKTFKPTEKIILEKFDNIQDAMQAEVDLHEFYQVDKNPHFANRSRAKMNGFYYCANGENNPFYGRRHTKELKEKFSQRMKSLGENHPSKSEEHRELIRNVTIKRMKSYGENMENHPCKKPEVRKKISESLKSLGENHPSRLPQTRIKQSECRKGEKNHFYGRSHTEETRKLISLKNSGRKQDPEVVERRKQTSLKYKYLFISPSNERFEINNANEFCIANNLNSCCIYNVARGNYSHHNGWKVVRISKNQEFTEEYIQNHLRKLESIPEEKLKKCFNRRDSEETKRKKSMAAKGVKKSKSAIDKRTKSFCKYIWTFVSPEGITYEHYNCNEFCREHNLCQSQIGRLARGETSTYKGWKASRRLRTEEDK